MNDDMKYCYEYPHPAVTTDCVIFGFDGTKLKVLLIERGIDPYKGKWALPGGFLRMDESAEEGALRELKEETGLETAYIKQFHTFTAPLRDPRERVITIAYYALVRLQEVIGGDDAARAEWFALDDVPALAFDHDQILRIATRELRQQIHFEPVGFELLPKQFTIRELQSLYEAILDVRFDRRNFYKKMQHLELLTQVNNDDPSSRRQPFYFEFNAEKYAELKHKGFRLEF
jgi:8-oxo-dGTP diphosphatase